MALCGIVAHVYGVHMMSMDASQLISSYEQAVASIDVDGLLELYADHVRVFDGTSAWQYPSKDEWRAAVVEWFGYLSGNGVCEIREPRVAGSDDLVVICGLAFYAADDRQGGRAEIVSRFTQVWEPGDGGPRITHEHTSLPLDDQCQHPLPQPTT